MDLGHKVASGNFCYIHTCSSVLAFGHLNEVASIAYVFVRGMPSGMVNRTIHQNIKWAAMQCGRSALRFTNTALLSIRDMHAYMHVSTKTQICANVLT